MMLLYKIYFFFLLDQKEAKNQGWISKKDIFIIFANSHNIFWCCNFKDYKINLYTRRYL
jgi:hypothetical protein